MISTSRVDEDSCSFCKHPFGIVCYTCIARGSFVTLFFPWRASYSSQAMTIPRGSWRRRTRWRLHMLHRVCPRRPMYSHSPVDLRPSSATLPAPITASLSRFSCPFGGAVGFLGYLFRNICFLFQQIRTGWECFEAVSCEKKS